MGMARRATRGQARRRKSLSKVLSNLEVLSKVLSKVLSNLALKRANQLLNLAGSTGRRWLIKRVKHGSKQHYGISNKNNRKLAGVGLDQQATHLTNLPAPRRANPAQGLP